MCADPHLIRQLIRQSDPCKPDIFAATYESVDAQPTGVGRDALPALDDSADVITVARAILGGVYPDDKLTPSIRIIAKDYIRLRLRDAARPSSDGGAALGDIQMTFWLILSCTHWLKWTGDEPPTSIICPTCGVPVELLAVVPVAAPDPPTETGA